jgi:hypothetical protein
VVLWPLELKFHFTVSPGRIVTDGGEKLKPLLPTSTVTVVADAAFSQSASKTKKLIAPARALPWDAAFFLFHFEFDGRVAILLSSLLRPDAQFLYRP